MVRAGLLVAGPAHLKHKPVCLLSGRLDGCCGWWPIFKLMRACTESGVLCGRL